MRKNGQDRSRFPSNPLEDTRKIERLRDEDSVLEVQSSGTSEVNVEVDGAIPKFTGVPAGKQQFYVASNLRAEALEITTLSIARSPSLLVSQDVSNVFGKGSNRIIVQGSTGDSVALVDMTTGEVDYFPHLTASADYGWITQSNADFAVTKLLTTTSTPTINVAKNGTVNRVSFSPPPGMTVAFSSGISADGQSICIFWGSANTSGSGTVRVAFYTPTGTYITATNAYSVTSVAPRLVQISNGWVVYSNPVRIFACDATPTDQFTIVDFSPAQAESTGSRRVTNDGYFHHYYTSGTRAGDMYTLNLNTGTSIVSVDTIFRYQNNTLVGTVGPSFILGVDANNVIFGGSYTSGGVVVPIYCWFDASPTPGSVISDSVYTAYPGTTSNARIVWACRTTDNDVVYCIETPSSGAWMVKVTGQ